MSITNDKNRVLAKTTQYLFFKLNGENYALKADKVKEIVDYVQITKIPQAHESVIGVTNIRGDIIPIVDPNIRFGFDETVVEKRTSFIIIRVGNSEDDEEASIAIIVDLVDEVDDIKEIDILPTPQFGTNIKRSFIKNMLRYKENYITVLDVDNMLSIKELSQTQGDNNE